MVAPNTEEVSFVVALPGWEVLYYVKGGDFSAVAVIAWGVILGSDGVSHVHPVTVGAAEWPLDQERPLCSPDGDVSYNGKNWPTVWAWLDEMKTTEPTALAISHAPTGVLALDKYRHKFAIPHGDGS